MENGVKIGMFGSHIGLEQMQPNASLLTESLYNLRDMR
jgi:hypothetical protein